MAAWIFLAVFAARNLVEPLVAFGKPHRPPRPGLGTGLGTLLGMIIAFGLSGLAVFAWLRGDGPGFSTRFAIGLSLFVCGFLGRVLAVRQLGPGYSQTFCCAPAAPLVTTGLFRRLRHPIYALFELETIALCVVRPNWVSAAAVGLVLAICVARIKQEEAQLVARFGDDYRAYARRSKAMIPLVW